MNVLDLGTLKTDVPDSLPVQMREELPEVDQISDADLHRRVLNAWALAIHNSSFSSIRDIPGSGNPGKMVMVKGDQSDHVRGVTRHALATADDLLAAFPDIGIRRDVVIAGGLCHDVGKPFEFDPENLKRWREKPQAVGLPLMRHPAYGAFICLAVGLPHEVVHIAGAHSGDGELLVRSLECTLVHNADIAFWSTMLSAGMIQDGTVSQKYVRPLSL